MEYSFIQLEKEFKERGIQLTDEKVIDLGLLNLYGEITDEGILLSDQCSHRIKIIDYTVKNEVVDLLTGSIIAQYSFIKEKVIQLSKEMNYPLESLLEAITNAVIHRDYRYNGDTIIRIYKDKLEITSLGNLIRNLTVEGIELGISEIRNRSMLKVFQILGIVKGNGEGVQKIIAAYKHYKVKPIFKSIGGVFQVILPKPEYIVDGKVISEKYRQILGLIEEKGVIKNREIQTYLKVKNTTVVNYLKEMLELGLIEKIRNGRNISYKIK